MSAESSLMFTASYARSDLLKHIADAVESARKSEHPLQVLHSARSYKLAPWSIWEQIDPGGYPALLVTHGLPESVAEVYVEYESLRSEWGAKAFPPDPSDLKKEQLPQLAALKARWQAMDAGLTRCEWSWVEP